MSETLLPDQVAIHTRADLAPLEPAFAAALAVIRARHGVERYGDRWNLVGVIDFGDAMGFVCDDRSSRRLAAWSALHQYNALARFLSADHGADALDVMRALLADRVTALVSLNAL